MSEYIAHQESLGEFTLKIIHDEDAFNPRTEYDGHLGKMVCWHRRYDLGDEQPRESPDEYIQNLVDVDAEIDRRLDGLSWGDLTNEEYEDKEEIIRDSREQIAQELFAKDYISLPLYLYDHSGITMSTGPFGCPWDSGQVGFIYVSVKDALSNWGSKSLDDPVYCPRDENTKTCRERAIDLLKSEVEEYDDYLTGNCYGYTITNGDGDEVDSCWGFLGDYNGYVLEQAREQLNYFYSKTPLQLPLPTMEELKHV